MPLNTPTQAIIDAYQPRLSIQLNGKDIPMALSADVTSNNWYQADRASAEFALFNDSNFGPKFWGSMDTMLLDIRYVLLGQSPVSLILGQVDHIDIDWVNGKVRLEMRDLTSNFIDHRTYGSFLNKTSSQIATELATKYGMTADVDSTTTPVGRYYESEHDETSDGEFNKSITEWDLLTFLAQNEGDANSSFNVWVTGQTLHFRKATPIDTGNPWIITTQVPQYNMGQTSVAWLNATELKLQRSLTLAKDIVVVVRSWNSQQRGAVTATSPKGSANASSSTKNPAQRFVFRRPNLTKDQAQKLADSMREELTRHERIIEWSDAGGFPNALQLTPRDILQLQGTQSSWDQRYYIDAITRTLSVDGGLVMNVKAKNHTTESQTVA